MRLSSRLVIVALIPTLMALVAIGGVAVSFAPMADLQQRQLAMIQIRTDLNSLNELARGYVLHHDDRSRRQFVAQADETAKRLRAASVGVDPASRERMETLMRDVDVVDSLFARMVANYHPSRGAPASALFKEAEDRLTAQLFIRSGEAVSTAGSVLRLLSDQIVATERRILLFVMGFTLLAAGVLTGVSMALRRSITGSLRRLGAGTEAVGAGDLGYRIGIESRDELGDLGRSFDRMTERLQHVTVSRDDLEREVDERRHAEERAMQELETTTLLLEASAALSHWTGLRDVTEGLADLIVRITDHERSTIETWEESHGAIVVVASAGQRPLEIGRRWSLDEMSPASRTAIVERRTQVIDADAVAPGAPEGADALRRAHDVLYVPLVQRDQVVGMIVVDDPEGRRGFTERDVSLVEGIAAQAAVAIENARLYEAEQKRHRRIETLHGVVEVAISSLDARGSALRMLDYLVREGGLEMASIWVADAAELRPFAHAGYPPRAAPYFEPIPLAAALDAPRVYRGGRPVVVSDASLIDPALAAVYEEMRIPLGAYVIMPLRSRGRTMGTLDFVWRESHSITPEDVDFYMSLGSEVGVVLENAQLYETEHDIADRLQSALLALPERLPGIAAAHAYHSATETARVGGDFYDMFDLDDERIGITIGDVAGKGIDAAVLTSLVKYGIRAHAGSAGRTPADVLRLTNDMVYRATPSESFVTVSFAIMDRHSGDLVYASAGHTTGAAIRTDGEVIPLPPTGPLLGAFPKVEYRDGAVSLAVGDLMFLYTDGLTEARKGRELFGEQRLFELLGTLRAAAPEAAVRRVISEVLAYTGGGLRDDLALLAVARTPEPHAEPLPADAVA